jgi:hypothetical protein
MASVLLFSLFSLNFSNMAEAGVMLGVVLANLLGMGAWFSGKEFAPEIKEKKGEKTTHEMMVQYEARQSLNLIYLSLNGL